MTARGKAILELAGRAAIALGVAFITTRVSEGSHLAVSLAVGVIWLLSLQMGFAAKAAELLALGSSVAVTRGVLVGLVSVSALSVWLPSVEFDAPRLLLAAVMIFGLVIAWEAVLARIAPPRRILLVGTSGAGQDVARELQASPRARFELIGVVGDGGRLDDDLEAPMIGEIDELADLIRIERPSIIVVAVDRNRPAIFAPLLDSADAGFRVVEAAQFMEHAFGHVPVRDIQRAWFMSVLHLYQQPYSRLAKRQFDILVATIGLLTTLPLMPLLFLLVRLSPGPVILRQVRIGEFGRPFTMYKFRTMRPDAEELGQAIWAKDRDPRVTRVGRFMRILRLDEIPQLWNVIRGDMSIVGPRPERPEFMHFLEQRVPFWSHRQLIKPGITGWAQVRRGYTADAEGSIDKLSYDLWYLRHRSIVVDIAICLRTLGVLLAGMPETRRRPMDTAPALPDGLVAPEVVPVWTGNATQSSPGTQS